MLHEPTQYTKDKEIYSGLMYSIHIVIYNVCIVDDTHIVDQQKAWLTVGVVSADLSRTLCSRSLRKRRQSVPSMDTTDLTPFKQVI